MKKSGIALLLTWAMAAMVFAQEQAPGAKPATPQIARTNAVEVANVPTESDMYCSGFVSPTAQPRGVFVAGGSDSPFTTHYSDRTDVVFLTGGALAEGAKLHILRGVIDPNRYEFFPGQMKLTAAAGKTYEEVGRVRVLESQKGIAIAEIELACDAILPGDLAVPWEDRPAPKFRYEAPWKQLIPPNGKATGRIVGAKDFDYTLGQKSKVYLNIGANQGLKAGDYLRATRMFSDSLKDNADSLSYKASVVDNLLDNPPVYPKEKYKDLPRKSLGEMMVLYTTPTTATAMVTRAVEPFYVGDGVEVEEEQPPPPPPPAPPMNPPTITCNATPATIRVGETASIRCDATSPDERALSYTFNTDNGTLNPRENTAMFDSRNAHPGLVNITTTVADDRGLSANAVTRVNVEAAPAPAVSASPSKIGEIVFKANSARVDNAAKAMLDGVALRMQREAGSQVVLAGGSIAPESARLSTTRAGNAKTYLTGEKGIDAGRIQTADGGRAGRKADVWFVPAGATPPTVSPVPDTTPAAPAKKPAAKVTPSSNAVKPASTSATKPAPKTTTKAKTPPKGE